jgi:hypothetical protein
MALDGTNQTPVLSDTGQISQLATDGANLFYGDRKDATLHRIAIADRTDNVLGQSIEVIYGVAVSRSDVFYSRTSDTGNDPNSLVQHMPSTGGTPASPPLTVDSPHGLDWADDTLYVAFANTVAPVINDVRSPAIFAGGVVIGVRVDGDGLLLTIRDAKTLVRVPRVGGAPTILANGLTDPGQVVATQNAIYYTEISLGRVQRLAR